MKYLFWFTGVLLTLVVAVYVMTFTSLGNNIVRSIVEKKIKEQTKLDSRLTTFTLSMSDFSIVLEIDRYNILLLNGNYSLFSQSFDIAYRVRVNRLDSLNALTNAPLRGKFHTQGTVKGDMDFIEVNGISDLADSDTMYHIELANLKEFSLASVKASVKNLNLSKVLYMLKQPHYADAIFSLDVDITDARSGKLKGVVKSSVKKGLIDSTYMTKAYRFRSKMPRTRFTMETLSRLDGDVVDTKLKLNSTLASFDIKRARFNIADASLVSDYVAKIPNLDKLFFVTDTHMKGAMEVDGELRSAKDLDLTIHSKIAGGVMDAKLHNDDFHADLKSVQTLDVLHMLIYPEIFKSTLNGKVDYNLATSKGTFSGHLVDGKFTKNQMLNLVKKYGKVDLYREKFKGDISAKINKEKILASLDLKSRTASIKTINTKLNTLTQKIDSKVTIKTKKYPLTVTLKGDVISPKVGIDAKALLESETGKKIQKEVEKKVTKLFNSLFK